MSESRKVPLLDLTRFDPDLEAEAQETFLRVFRSGRYILGPEVEAFEEECAEYLGARHAIGVSSGTDALLVALMALEIGAGDEVICPTYTFFATAGTIWRSGARPVFVDILPDSYNADPEDVARKMTPRTRAVIPVHLFGRVADMESILEMARSGDAAVVEDAAQAIGATDENGRRAGTFGDLACFSFFPSKNLAGFGDGGLVTTGDDDLARKVKALRVHGGEPKYYHKMVGGNFRIDALQAALLRLRLRRLDEATSRRRRNAALYNRLFLESGLARRGEPSEDGPPLGIPAESPGHHIFNQYVVRVCGAGKRDRLREALAERGIGTEIYYPVPLHLQECFAGLGYREGDFPAAEKAARETLALPIFPELEEDEIERVAGTIIASIRDR